MMQRRRKVGAIVLVLGIWFYLGNTSHLAEPLGEGPWMIAHRGVHQRFHLEGIGRDTCTAERILPPEHSYLENTIASMRAAFDHGAAAVEIDLHPTTDGRFAVFHDWKVDCRTEGSGATREHSLGELQVLDVGHGYTADGGETFPFRGQGLGLMPSLDEVLSTFPDRDFVLDVKGNDREEGLLLASRLKELGENRSGSILVYGGPEAVAAVRERLPDTMTITRRRLKRCLVRYLALGWTGHVSEVCANALITVPSNVAPWLWGWPDRFLQRMASVGSSVVLIGEYQGESLSRGFDSAERLRDLPPGYSGGVWTDRIEVLGPAALSDGRPLAAELPAVRTGRGPKS